MRNLMIVFATPWRSPARSRAPSAGQSGRSSAPPALKIFSFLPGHWTMGSILELVPPVVKPHPSDSLTRTQDRQRSNTNPYKVPP